MLFVYFIFLLFLMFIFLGVPIAFSMGMFVLVYFLIEPTIPFEVIPLVMVQASNSFVFIAIPFFIFAGELMNASGITDKIFTFAIKLVGHITGGLGQVNVLASLIFAGMSGTAIADAAGLGVIEINAMKKSGFDSQFSASITAASSILGPIIPPSNGMIILGGIMGISVAKLFIGAIIPGVLMAVGMMIIVYIIAKKKKYSKSSRASIKEIFISFKNAFLPLLTPIILVGGILGGIFTPTEAGAVASTYAFILGIYYRKLNLKKLVKVLENTIVYSSSVMILICFGSMVGWIITKERIGIKMVNIICEISNNPIIVLLLIQLLLLILGLFINGTTVKVMLAPLFILLIKEFNYDPVQFGVLMQISQGIGLITPPVGSTLYVVAKIGDVSVETLVKGLWPYILLFIVCVVIFCFFPKLITFLPSLMR